MPTSAGDDAPQIVVRSADGEMKIDEPPMDGVLHIIDWAADTRIEVPPDRFDFSAARTTPRGRHRLWGDRLGFRIPADDLSGQQLLEHGNDRIQVRYTYVQEGKTRTLEITYGSSPDVVGAPGMERSGKWILGECYRTSDLILMESDPQA